MKMQTPSKKIVIISSFTEEEDQYIIQESNNISMEVDIINPDDLEYNSKFGITFNGGIISRSHHALIILTDKKLNLVREVARQFQYQNKKVLGLNIEHRCTFQDNLGDLLDLNLLKLPIPNIIIREDNILVQEKISEKDYITLFVCDYKVMPWLKIIDNTQEIIDNMMHIDPKDRKKEIKKEVIINKLDFFLFNDLSIIAEKVSVALGRPTASILFGKTASGFIILNVNKIPKIELNEENEMMVQHYLKSWKKTLENGK